ncbi:MAG TPA: 4-(cytidine 5'-diphospho)-2-C-methyl-D-erythritol kinase [Bryobacteraceae bacterium]|jgi:4-diphosphocytidyl-2-C-methyl-D-erythritol kinase|nr:4-(cytidine 5'-diphospho)-2-C-methyl-D-erythritol kinase [Bryobacteraceae bacterium]
MHRSTKISALAKINLDLRVLQKRPDGFHELRTVFQTISLADSIEIDYEPARRTELTLDGNVEIADNLVLRAARAVLESMKTHARVRFRLTKRIPMGAGLGGGSSDAAAVLLALPVLAGKTAEIHEIAAGLGSDVPFFLEGGTAVAVGRGTEFYSLPDVAEQPVFIAAGGVHVSTAEAYRALDRSLTFTGSLYKINGFQSFVRALDDSRRADLASASSENDFEAVVFRQFPNLKTIREKLSKCGAVARMTGSGSAIFAIYASERDRERARESFNRERVVEQCELLSARLVSRRSYQRMWRRQLAPHLAPESRIWPPRSRYAR